MREFISDRRIADYVSGRTGTCFDGSAFTCLGILRDGNVTAGVVFNHYTGHDINVTVAGKPGAFTKVFLARVAAYVFDELDCCRVSVTTEQPSVVGIAKRLGATVEGIKTDQFGTGRDGVMLGLLKKNWFMTRRLRPNSAKAHVKEI